MEVKTYSVKVTFLREILGSQSTGDVMSRYVAEKNGITMPEDEINSLPEALDKGTTVFFRDRQDRPILFDYQVKGFIKNAGKVLNGKSGMPKNLRSKINDLVFISPREILLHLPDGEELTYKERPLRAETAQGPRVALARSEMLPVDTWCKFGVEVLPGEIDKSVLEELLDYGYYQGLGQWRNARWGSFRYELVEES